MAINSFSFSDVVLDAFVGIQDHLDGHYPNNTESPRSDDVDAPLSIDHLNNDVNTIFFPDLPGTCDSLLSAYGENWSMYQYNNPFAPSPAPVLDHDNTSSVGTVDEPFSPIPDATAVGPSIVPSDFELPSPYEVDNTYITNDFGTCLNLDVAASASGLSSPNASPLYDPFSGYGHPSQFVFGAATDASSHARPSQGVDVSAGEVPFTFTYPPSLLIADEEDTPAVPQAAQAENEVRPTSSTPRRVTRRKHEPVSEVANEDSESDDKPAKRGKPEYRCKFCPSVFDRLYNRNVHVAAVHEGKKGHVCPHAKCTQAFSRKHDLVRHMQSFHTNFGSPRRHPPTNGEQKADKQKN